MMILPRLLIWVSRADSPATEALSAEVGVSVVMVQADKAVSRAVRATAVAMRQERRSFMMTAFGWGP